MALNRFGISRDIFCSVSNLQQVQHPQVRRSIKRVQSLTTMVLERLARTPGKLAPLRKISEQRVWQRSFSSTATSQSPADSTAATPASKVAATDGENDFSSLNVAGPPADEAAKFDPLERSRSRTRQLPTSRYAKVRNRCMGPLLTSPPDTRLVLHDTTEVRSILTSLLRSQIPPPESSFPVPSPFLECSKSMRPQQPTIS